MKLISWNLASRVGCVAEQVQAVLHRSPDVVAFQEVTVRTRGELRERLAGGGLVHAVDSFDHASAPALLRGPRRYGVLVASRFPLELDSTHQFEASWPERILAVDVVTPIGAVLVCTVHVPPGSSNGWVKIETLKAICAGLACPSSKPRILCGDFNTPQEEHPDGRVVTWAETVYPTGEIVLKRTIRGKEARGWDAAERQVLLALAEFDLPDLYRALHGYGVQDFSWYLRRGERRIGRRFDHVFASRSLKPTACRYLHSFREEGLSDHSAIEVEFST
jgi:exonuclease III